MNSSNQNNWIDGSLYPDRPVPGELKTLAEKVDFIVRVCVAWDFALPPRSKTLAEILKEEWKEAVKAAQLLTSCAYHWLREFHHLPPLPYSGPEFPHIFNDPFLEFV